MSDPNNAWGGSLKQSAGAGGFGLAFDPAVATTLSRECASMLSAMEQVSSTIAGATGLKPLNLKESGPDLSALFNNAATDLTTRVLNGHKTILTDMGETFIAAGRLYQQGEEDSRTAFEQLKSTVGHVEVATSEAQLPGWGPSKGWGSESYSSSPERDYSNKLGDTQEAESLATGAQEAGITLKPSSIDPETGENFGWDEFVAHYNHVDGGQIPGQLQQFADTWKRAADQLRMQAAAFHCTYDPLLLTAPAGSDSEGVWASPAAAKAKSALNDYLHGVERLINCMNLMSRNLAFTQGWILRLQTFLPHDSADTYHLSGRAEDAELRQIRTTWDAWYVEGAKISGGNIPEVPEARSTVTTPTGNLPTSLTEMLIGDQSPAQIPMDPLALAAQLDRGIPIEIANADGSNTVWTPNPDGTVTTARSTVGPDGTVTTVSKVGDGPETTSVSTPRNDGTGVIDTVTTAPNGTVQRVVSTPTGDGRISSRSVNPDGTTGPEMMITPLQEGGLFTQIPSDDGQTVTNLFTAADGSSYSQTLAIAPDGGQQLISTANSNGTRSIMEPDGAVFTQTGDGASALTTKQPNGAVVAQFDNGTVLASDPPQPGQSAPSTWEAVQNAVEPFMEKSPLTYGIDGAKDHPYATLGGAAASGVAASLDEGGKGLARQAGFMSQTSQLLGQEAMQDLGDGKNVSGKAIQSVSTSIADDASKLGSNAKLLGNVGKFGGPLATVGFSTYTSIDDWRNGKDGWEAAGAGVGSAVGGIGGGIATGAAAGALLTGPIAPVGAVVGAVIGGVAFGALGGWVGENTVKAVK
ncbi:hypothetical protein HLB23_10400 [Nocardia uniformis]|uniref:Uncharacterized protein n=1 Tax=Nocardia uniformis TaxID=53432 RepID=A0A849BYD5_9NOCA|nr:hypothetical protein [Nocardia uniformis]NNH70268.1 hypothetical protein [Nocardia uniformis]